MAARLPASLVSQVSGTCSLLDIPGMTWKLFSLCAPAADKAAQVLTDVLPALPAIKRLFDKAKGVAFEDTDMAGKL